jgi:hypothetical protein
VQLYALLSLALPKVFPISQAHSFVRHFTGDSGNSADGLKQLHALLAPVVLRRTLADVASLGV